MKGDSRAGDLLIKKDHNIVVVDDDPMVLKILDANLVYILPTCKVNSFEKVDDDFYDYIYNNDIDLFIMDVCLGKHNAVDISQKIIENKKCSIFLFVSGYDYNIESFEKLKGKCIYDFMSKPFIASVFVGSIVTLLNISTTYKMLFKDRDTIENIRNYYIDILEKDKQMIKEMEQETEKLKIKSTCLNF